MIGGLIERTVTGEKPIRIFGELVALLWQQGNHTAALHLETLWNELCPGVHPFSLLCAYPLSLFAKHAHEQAFMHVLELCTSRSSLPRAIVSSPVWTNGRVQ